MSSVTMDVEEIAMPDLGPSASSSRAHTRPEPSPAPSGRTSRRFSDIGLDYEADASSLPPIDGGRDAWLFLVAATVCETLIWGLPYSIGVLHAYWTNRLFGPGESESTVTLAATLQSGLMYISAGLLGPIFTAYPRWTKQIQYAGIIVCSAGIIASAFATKPWHLIITIGLLYPFAGATYLPCATLLFEWFSAKRGLANGIMYSGTGAGGAVFPFIISALLNRVGYKATMISVGLGFLLLGSTSLLFIKRRIPIAGARTRARVDWGFLKRVSFLAGAGVILFTGFGGFVPSVWIPSFADDINSTRPNGTALVAIMNAASVPGATLTGYMTDRLAVRTTILLYATAGALACLVFWGFASSSTLLVVFSLAWGLTGLSIVGVWGKAISVIAKNDDPSAPALIFSIFASLKGIGSMTSGPVSDALLKSEAFRGAAGAYGFKNYGALLVYTGATTLVGGLCGMLLRET